MGDRDSIYGFAALGLDTFPVTDPAEASKKLRQLAEGEYAVVYITEPHPPHNKTHKHRNPQTTQPTNKPNQHNRDCFSSPLQPCTACSWSTVSKLPICHTEY